MFVSALRTVAVPFLVVAAIFAGSGLLFAQIEGPERGVVPIAATGDLEVTGIEVDVEGDDAFDARAKGWKEAQRKAWTKLYARSHGGAKSSLPDGTLNSIVSAIVVEQEQIGNKRYKARLGVLFDRARTSAFLGMGGQISRSPPLLVMPIHWTAGTASVFEQQTEWQRAWAKHNFGESPIDYVRPYGTGAESIVLTAGQANNRSRQWWRGILDQFGAADVIIPIARLDYEYPGGPVTGYFAARSGPDNRFIDSFVLRVGSSDEIPAMFDKAVERMDGLYARALSQGMLKTDKSLVSDPFDLGALEEQIQKEIEAIEKSGGLPAASRRPTDNGSNTATTESGSTENASANQTSRVSIQFDTPDASAFGAAQSSVRSVPGVASAAVSSTALGGVSVMQVTYNGDIAALASALRARGWQVQQGAGALRIRRPGGAAPTPQPAPPPAQDEPQDGEE